MVSQNQNRPIPAFQFVGRTLLPAIEEDERVMSEMRKEREARETMEEDKMRNEGVWEGELRENEQTRIRFG